MCEVIKWVESSKPCDQKSVFSMNMHIYIVIIISTVLYKNKGKSVLKEIHKNIQYNEK